jgi:hypothetical protein
MEVLNEETSGRRTACLSFSIPPAWLHLDLISYVSSADIFHEDTNGLFI